VKPIVVDHLITGLGWGGAESMLSKLLSRIDRSRFQCSVISMVDGGGVAGLIESLDIPVQSLGLRRGEPNPLGLFRLVRQLRQRRPCILQSWLYHADLAGILAGRLCRVPAIAWNIRCSNFERTHTSWLSRAVVGALSRLSRAPEVVVVNSEGGKAFHASMGYRPRRWHLIPNGFDVKQFRPDHDARASVRQELGFAPEARLVGLVARFHPMKDHHTFLQAASLLRDEKIPIQFVLVGRNVDYRNDTLVRMVRVLGLTESVRLLGERSDIPRIMAALDLFSLSSAFGEGWPNVVGEAMASGVPCVVTDVGDAAQIVGDTGRVVPPRSAAALAAAWREVLSLGPDERAHLGRAARARIEACFSLSDVVTQYEDLYEELARACAE
jgi:glycosyltransferase involved in cell wall biosynthesis